MSEVLNKMEEVVLEIEETAVKCNKKDLIDHSDYFKAMFEGNFVERNKNVVKLKDVPKRSMNIILSLLKDPENLITVQKEEDVLSVLQTSCMLQFNKIKNACIKNLINILSASNCARIWLFAENLNLKSLRLKAKYMALIHFNFVKDLNIIMDYDLTHLCKYLKDTSLQCENELDIFEVCMKWWRENSEELLSDVKNAHVDSFQTKVFMKFLSCLDFKKLSSSDIHEMITYPDLSKNNDVKEILQCIMTNIESDLNISYDFYVIDEANKLYNCRSRYCKQLPCVSKLSKLSAAKASGTLNSAMASRKKGCDIDVISEYTLTITYYDVKDKIFRKFLTLEIKANCNNFNVFGYKEFLVLIGEPNIGYNRCGPAVWVYNTITESWKLKFEIPNNRTRFESLMIGSTLYIIGSIRHLPNDIVWYDFEEDKLSESISIPCFHIPINYCSWNGKLFLVDIYGKCAYAYNKEDSSWLSLVISDENGLVENFPLPFSLFASSDSLYIKGANLIELKIVDQKLIIANYSPLRPLPYDGIRSIVCDDIVYTLYGHGLIYLHAGLTTFAKHCIATGDTKFIPLNIIRRKWIPVEDDDYSSFGIPCIVRGWL